MSLYLGIDFGTSTNMVTYWNKDRKRAEPILLGTYGSEGYFSNVIYYESTTNLIVGDEAVVKGKKHYDNAVFAIKRRIENPGFQQYIPTLRRNVAWEEIAADIFSWIKNNVEKKFGGEEIDGVVISVPFAFQNRERKRIESAARRAGLNVLGLIEEPVAAALSFGIMAQTESGKKEKILVFDLGGGTFDVTIFDFQKFSPRQFKISVITTDGEKNLGGIDIDDMIVKKISDKMNKKFPAYDSAIRNSSAEEQEGEIFNIRQKAVEFKENLSYEDETDFIFQSNLGREFSLDEIFSREDFDNWLKEFLNNIENVLDNALADADLEPEDIDRIIMVGGSSNIPAVNETVRQYFGKQPEHIGNLKLLVGEGAGIYCGLKYVDKTLDCDISVGISKNTGLKWNGKFIEMLHRNTLYGTSSELQILTLPAGSNPLSIPVVQGNSVVNSKIGSIPVPSDIRQNLINGKIGVKLNIDADSGTFNYELYKIISRSGKLVKDKILSKDKLGDE